MKLRKHTALIDIRPGRGEVAWSPLQLPMMLDLEKTSSAQALPELKRHECRAPMRGSSRPQPSRKGRAANSSRKRRQGFTLVELLLVLVILGVLAAIVVPKFSGRSEQARVTAARSQIANFAVALDAFEIDNGFYPRGRDGLRALVEQPRDATNWRPYMESLPNDPWGNPYIYEAPGKQRPHSYDLMSMGPDGRVGGDDDITNWGDSGR